MDDNKLEIIHLEATEILKRMVGSKLYGEVIDLNSFDQTVVAAYYLGNSDPRLAWVEMRELDNE